MTITPLQREVEPPPTCSRCNNFITMLDGLYRCAQCHAAFDLPCIRKHFNWSANDRPHAAASPGARHDVPDLDAAWAAAWALVPDGDSLGVTSTVGVASGKYVATTSYGPVERGYAYADSPAEALRNLAAMLRPPVLVPRDEPTREDIEG